MILIPRGANAQSIQIIRYHYFLLSRNCPRTLEDGSWSSNQSMFYVMSLHRKVILDNGHLSQHGHIQGNKRYDPVKFADLKQPSGKRQH